MTPAMIRAFADELLAAFPPQRDDNAVVIVTSLTRARAEEYAEILREAARSIERSCHVQRDDFAAAALPAVMAARNALVIAHNDGVDTSSQESIAEECYELADAMLEARLRESES